MENSLAVAFRKQPSIPLGHDLQLNLHDTISRRLEAATGGVL